MAEMKAGRVGAVFASDCSRVGRNFTEWLSFLDECARQGVIIVNDGKAIDLNDQGSLLGTRILGLVAEYENAAGSAPTGARQPGRRTR